MKSPLIIIITVVAALFSLAGAGYFLLSNPSQTELPQPSTPPTEPPQPSTSPTEPPAPPRESKPPPGQPPLTFEQKMESLREAIADVCATGESQEVTLVFTEAEANNQAAELLATAEIPMDIPLEIESVYIDFQSDNNVLTETRSVIYDRFEVTIKVITQVSIEEGKPQIEVTKVSFGVVPLPQLLKDQIVGLITQQIDDLLSQLTSPEIDCNGKVDLEFKDISIQEEKLTVTVLIG